MKYFRAFHNRFQGGTLMMRYTVAIIGLMMCSITGVASADRGKSRFQDLEFLAVLTGDQEVTTPPGGVDTERTATGTADFDVGFTGVRVHVRVSDPTNVVAAHFHCGKPGENGPIVFGLISPGPLALEGNTIRGTLTNANANPAANCVPLIGRPVNNIAALALAIREGLVYLNIHTSAFPAGEIRGQMLEEHEHRH
jgi:hypothetical protein